MMVPLYSWICRTCSASGLSETNDLRTILERHDKVAAQCEEAQVDVRAEGTDG